MCTNMYMQHLSGQTVLVPTKQSNLYNKSIPGFYRDLLVGHNTRENSHNFNDFITDSLLRVLLDLLLAGRSPFPSLLLFASHDHVHYYANWYLTLDGNRFRGSGLVHESAAL